MKRQEAAEHPAPARLPPASFWKVLAVLPVKRSGWDGTRREGGLLCCLPFLLLGALARCRVSPFIPARSPAPCVVSFPAWPHACLPSGAPGNLRLSHAPHSLSLLSSASGLFWSVPEALCALRMCLFFRSLVNRRFFGPPSCSFPRTPLRLTVPSSSLAAASA